MDAGKAVTIHELIKIGKEEHIRTLYEKGILYMNTLQYFVKVEDNSQQQDNFEGATFFESLKKIEIKNATGEEIKFGDSADCDAPLLYGNLLIHSDASLGNIYCMFAVTEEFIKSKSDIDKRNKEFGDHFLLIHNPEVFLTRVYAALEERGVKYKSGLVYYFDREEYYRGRLTPFMKRNDYRHQNEFRLLVENKIDAVFILEIGSLKDIARLYKIVDESVE